jgi:hypothetical protein
MHVRCHRVQLSTNRRTRARERQRLIPPASSSYRRPRRNDTETVRERERIAERVRPFAAFGPAESQTPSTRIAPTSQRPNNLLRSSERSTIGSFGLAQLHLTPSDERSSPRSQCASSGYESEFAKANSPRAPQEIPESSRSVEDSEWFWHRSCACIKSGEPECCITRSCFSL